MADWQRGLKDPRATGHRNAMLEAMVCIILFVLFWRLFFAFGLGLTLALALLVFAVAQLPPPQSNIRHQAGYAVTSHR